MRDHAHYQELMLDSLYGLLEPEQQAELDAYLSGPEGESLRHQAEAWQCKLALVSKAEFTQVQFTVPSASGEWGVGSGEQKSVAASNGEKPIIAREAGEQRAVVGGGFTPHFPLPTPHSLRSKTGWVIAASVLILGFALTVPAGIRFMNWRTQANKVIDLEQQFVQAREQQKDFDLKIRARHDAAAGELKEASQAKAAIEAQFRKEEKAAAMAIAAKQYIVRLTGPERPQPGAPNEWQVVAQKRDGTTDGPEKVKMVVRDQKGEELLEQVSELGKKKFNEMVKLTLPVSFWKNDKIKPDTELFLDVVSYEKSSDTEPTGKLCERVPLVGSTYITYLATDKPMYKPGENVYFRSLTLDRGTFLPPVDDLTLRYRLTLPDKSVKEVDIGTASVINDHKIQLGPDKKPVRGLGCGQYAIATGTPGGEYTLTVLEERQNPGEQPRQIELANRKFTISEYKPELFFKKLEFDGKSYGPGDDVQVRCEASRTAGGELRYAIVVAYATVDGKAVPVQSPGKTDEHGIVRLKLTLPKAIDKGVASLSVTFKEKDDAEAIVRNIPVVGKKLNVEFFPEGGDLVAGVPCRVYFQVRTPLEKPADLEGDITDGTETVAHIRTLTDADLPGVNRGQGLFIFTPVAGKSYFLKIRKPIGIEEPAAGFALPKVMADGVVLTSLTPVSKSGEPLRVQVQIPANSKPRELLVGAYSRGRLIDNERVHVEGGKPVEVTLNPVPSLSGVTRVTVFEEIAGAEKPVAERLVYRQPSQQLNLNVNPDKQRYNPGSKVNLDVRATNEGEQPVPAILMVAVVNQSILTMADEKTYRSMPTQFLLASEVAKPEDLEHADFLLSDHPEAPVALDLLLGTQGWRRFVEQQNPANPSGAPPEMLAKYLVSNGQKSQSPIETSRLEETRVFKEYQPRYEVAQATLREAQESVAKIIKEAPEALARKTKLLEERDEAYRNFQAANAELRNYESRNDQAAMVFISSLGIGLLLVAAACLIISLRRAGAVRVRYQATSFASVIIVALTIGVLMYMEKNGSEKWGKAGAAAGHDEVALKSADLGRDGDGKEKRATDPTSSAMDERNRDLNPLQANEDGIPIEEPAVENAEAKQLRDPAPMRPAAAPRMRPMIARGAAQGGGPSPPAPAMMPANQAGPVNKGPLPAALEVPPPGPVGHVEKERAEEAKADKAENRLDPLAKKAKVEAKDAKDLAPQDRADLAAGRKLMPEEPMAPALFQDQRIKDKEAPEMMKRIGGGGGMGGGGRGGFAAGGRRQGGGEGFEPMGRQPVQQIARYAPFYAREYAHHHNSQEKDRKDFAETVYWQPVLVMPDSGKAEISFDLSDDVSRYQVLVAGHTLDGRIGSRTMTIEARQPFSVDPKVPSEVSAGDVIAMPIRVVNDSDDRRLVGFSVEASGLKDSIPARESIDLVGNTKGRRLIQFPVSPDQPTGDVSLKVDARDEPLGNRDEITRKFRVAPRGFPVSGAVSDLIEKTANARIVLPKDFIRGSLKVQLQVYPTTLADLQQGLEGLLQEPGGCFEQTSTSNYPNIMIIDYLKTSDQVKPELMQRAKGLIDRGYNRLISFECPDSKEKNKRGFEWFGSPDRQHEALTAYGLLQFKDLAKIYPVDAEMLKRTQAYLLSRRNGKGGFERNPTACDQFGGAPEHLTNAYIVWALVESDPSDKEKLDLTRELDALKKQALEHDQAKNDPYFLALVANSLLKRPDNGNRETAIKLLETIASKQQKTGQVTGASTSITRSGGRDLEIETTALAVLGWLRASEPVKFTKTIKDATGWISKQRGGSGSFGSTQATILALKALIEYTKANKKPAESGRITLKINGESFTKDFTEKDQEVITLEIPTPEKYFGPGENQATVEITTRQAYPFSLSWSGNALTPVSAEKCAVELTTALSKRQVAEGETVRLDVGLKNKTEAGQGMVVAIVGIPGGCKLPPDRKQLKELREKGVISFYETNGRELVLYWREIAPKGHPQGDISLSLDLIAEIPGDYSGPASRAYLYYNADNKDWVQPLKVQIEALPE